ncbi:unnamed protein product [Amoebophrya sp. A120]|nr:unnamed protein product [Amoebophrya sp. A120]|eukprot:GSA120T00008089001.1
MDSEPLCRPLYGSTALFAEDAHGTCPFYLKIGACRHGDQCSRHHVRPTSSQTLLLSHMYPVPAAAVKIAAGGLWEEETYNAVQKHLEDFYDEVFHELATYGEIEDMIVADNVSEHMLGNIYVKYFMEEDAEKALQKLNGRYYAGRMIKAEFSPVTDFREARCRAFHEARCNRGGYCNFLHIKHVPRANKRRLVQEMYEDYPHYSHKKERLNSKKKPESFSSSSSSLPKIDDPAQQSAAAAAAMWGAAGMFGHPLMQPGAAWDVATQNGVGGPAGGAFGMPAPGDHPWGGGGAAGAANGAGGGIAPWAGGGTQQGGKWWGGRGGGSSGSWGKGGKGGKWNGQQGGTNYSVPDAPLGTDANAVPVANVVQQVQPPPPAANNKREQEVNEENPPWPQFDPAMMKRQRMDDVGNAANAGQ